MTVLVFGSLQMEGPPLLRDCHEQILLATGGQYLHRCEKHRHDIARIAEDRNIVRLWTIFEFPSSIHDGQLRVPPLRDQRFRG